MAELLGRQASSIRRSKASGDLYALPAGTGRTTHFPRWQFEGHQAVPGLREIIPAFPRHYHPLSIERFMTSSNDDLDGQRPVQWLLHGGAVEAVVSLVDELAYQ